MRRCPNGETLPHHLISLPIRRRRRLNGKGITEVNKIALVKRTRGTETSQYLEERTSTETPVVVARSEEHTSELQSLMRISYAVFCLKKKNIKHKLHNNDDHNDTKKEMIYH